jgi:putative transcriptional regulator
MIFHNRLKTIRTEQEMTQETLAAAVGVTRQTIIAIEKEKFVPSAKLALELAWALNVKMDEIFWLSNE